MTEIPFNPPWIKPMSGWWCMVIFRRLECEDLNTGEKFVENDIVTVYGPYRKSEACMRAEVFNRSHQEADDGTPFYRPVTNAPAFLQQDKWCEHYATARPMNDVEW